MRRFKFLAIALCMMSLAACTEIFEKDIEDKTITIYTPNDSDTSISYLQTFWWSQVDFATSYQIQVVSPNFSAPKILILDSLVKTNRFQYYIGPGNFEWKVRALNGAYKSEYFGKRFIIDTTNLALQPLYLKSPLDGSSQSSTSINFIWNRILGAKAYQIQIDTVGDFNKPIRNVHTQSSSSLYTLPSLNKTYYWKVRGYNGADTTEWSQVFNFISDNTKPPKVTLSAPAKNSLDREATGTLQWLSLGDGYTYEVTIKVGSNASVTSSVPTAFKDYSGASGQTIEWSVIAINRAGTKGDPSEVWNFKIK